MTAPTSSDALSAIDAVRHARPRPHLLSGIARNPVGLGSSVFLGGVLLVGIFAPLLAPYGPDEASISLVLGPPSAEHPFGNDGSGRDVLSRLIYGARYSLAGAAVALAVALLTGVLSGLISGYFGRPFATVSSGAADLLQALPGIIVLLAARAVIGSSMWMAMVIFGILLSPAFYRLVSTLVNGVRNELYVDAARVSGLGDARIIGRHILTVVRAPLIIQAAIIAGVALAIQSGLEFLGLGDPRIPTWGSMLNDAFENMYRQPTLLWYPALAIGLTLLSLTLLANALRDQLERSTQPRRRRRAIAPVEIETMPVITHPGQHDRDELLNVSHLSVGYDQPDGSTTLVVKDLSLTVHRGEVHALVGESGSGKTQTAWSILGLLPEGGRAVAGAISFDGTDLVPLQERVRRGYLGKRIAYVPQEPMSNLDPVFTVGSQLVEPLMASAKVGRAEAARRALALLARVGIPDPQRTFAAYPHQLSGGMAQRVLIAGAVACEPDLLIADEPTTALDVTVQAEILDLLRELQADMQMAMILVTHNFGVVADLADRVSVMQFGRIVETGPTRSIFTDPQHPYTRELLGSILSGVEPRGPLEPATAGATVPIGGTR